MYFRTLAASLLTTGIVNAAPHAPSFPTHTLVTRASGIADTTVLGFWGQGKGDLSDVCNSGSFNVVVLSFITKLNPPTLNLGASTGSPSSAQSAKSGWGLFDGTVAGDGGQSLADQITACQSKGVKIMVAFGGDSRTSTATFSSSDEAVQSAQYVWDLFLGGTGSEDLRPFGSKVTLDGIDIDNESGNGQYYPDFVKTLRSSMGNSTSKQYFISADPMCAEDSTYTDDSSTSIPDSILPYLDWVNVQFYNANDQSVGGSAFQETMQTWAKKLSAVTPAAPKLLLGIPGGPGEANDGIQTASEISETISSVKSWNIDGFSGVGIWDCGSAMTNTGFLDNIKSSLGGSSSNSTSKRLL